MHKECASLRELERSKKDSTRYLCYIIMRLSPRELEGLLIHQTGFLAQKRLARGLKLNQPEAVALIACQVSTGRAPNKQY